MDIIFSKSDLKQQQTWRKNKKNDFFSQFHNLFRLLYVIYNKYVIFIWIYSFGSIFSCNHSLEIVSFLACPVCFIFPFFFFSHLFMLCESLSLWLIKVWSQFGCIHRIYLRKYANGRIVSIQMLTTIMNVVARKRNWKRWRERERETVNNR